MPADGTDPLEFIEAIFRNAGYRIGFEATSEDTNADCAAITTLAFRQWCRATINAFISGKEDPNNTSVMITQTGGGCRATNYVAFLRKALREAGLEHVPVIALSAQNFEKNPGLKFTLPILHHALQALCYGDLLSTLLLRVRPYETIPGSANELYRIWSRKGVAFNRESKHDGLSEEYRMGRKGTDADLAVTAEIAKLMEELSVKLFEKDALVPKVDRSDDRGFRSISAP